MAEHKLIDLTINEEVLEKTVKLAKERNVIIPTFEEMKHPELIPDFIKEELKDIGLNDVNPRNLYRISWKNQPVEKGGLFNELPNYIEIPSAISGVKARIFAMSGKYFAGIGAHKIGPSFSCLVPRLVTGQFDPTFHSAVWPSTGNYCRGGAYNSKLLGCKSIAILPENMSAERFNWLKKMADEVIATYGCESNVKEIYDETWRLRRERDNVMIFNQFGELGNHLWHYEVTGNAFETLLKKEMRENDRLAGVCLTSGSGGTLGAGDYLKETFPGSKLAVGEALQCPTLLNNGSGDHRIEGIGDKHVPWVHNVKNTDMVMAIDDNDAVGLFRLFNEPEGQAYLKEELGIDDELIQRLNWVGISGAANILMAVKMAKYYEFTENDCIVTVLTDSAEMYGSRLEEMKEERGREYTKVDAAVDHAKHVLAQSIQYVEELTYYAKKRIHNLKYYTWIEQQQYDVAELNAQWYDYDNYWGRLHTMTPELDKLIKEFNERTGLLKK
jgi:cysteine synthase